MRVQSVADLTDAPNAMAVGLGPTRRVIIWDTLLDSRFADDEVRVVLAHELGHHARDHLPKSLAWYALFAFPGAFLIARATRRRGGMARPEAVPLGLFVLVSLSLLALPRAERDHAAPRGRGGLGRARDHGGAGRGA